uniref:E3 ubiquitin-protein ligase NRDP1 n=1 Tax=Romanomermis culicivorax TaxID=13658 RepID=A0A915IAD8_ROMCU
MDLSLSQKLTCIHVPHASSCEHAFCKNCIEEWLKQRPTCPVDRQPLVPSSLVPQHNCLADLRYSIAALENRVDECQQLISDQSMTIFTQQTRIDELEERIKIFLNIAKSMINENYRTHSIVDSISNNDSGEQCLAEIDREELQIWACSLPEATITRWGGMISTPDPGLQTSIRRALIECGCPSTCAELLIDRAHERRWPRGLATLDVRQSNRIRYENYLCRRIPGKQAVVILSLDNLHMPREMICSPVLFSTATQHGATGSRVHGSWDDGNRGDGGPVQTPTHDSTAKTSTYCIYLIRCKLTVEAADALIPLPPRPIKCGRHERFSTCAPPIRCQKFCPSQTTPGICPLVCLRGCVCKPGYVRDIRKGNPCIRECECPDDDDNYSGEDDDD